MLKPDYKVAHDLCRLADLAYDVFRDDKANPPGSFCVGNYAFIIREYEDRVYIVFQGTRNRGQLWADLKAAFRQPIEVQGWPPVHIGFWQAFWTCRAELEPRIPSGKNIFMGGHSLAGEMVKKAASYLTDRGHKIAGVYTWGCPNGGGIPWATWYNAKGIPTFDFIRGRDPIPFEPFYGVPTGQQIFIDARGRIISERMKLNWWNIWGRLTEISWHEDDGYLADMDILEQENAA